MGAKKEKCQREGHCWCQFPLESPQPALSPGEFSIEVKCCVCGASNFIKGWSLLKDSIIEERDECQKD